jgi:hypothetical protein
MDIWTARDMQEYKAFGTKWQGGKIFPAHALCK